MHRDSNAIVWPDLRWASRHSQWEKPHIQMTVIDRPSFLNGKYTLVGALNGHRRAILYLGTTHNRSILASRGVCMPFTQPHWVNV
jgi:hypothetical protein